MNPDIPAYGLWPLVITTFEHSPKAYANPELGEKVKRTTRKAYRQLQRLY